MKTRRGLFVFFTCLTLFLVVACQDGPTGSTRYVDPVGSTERPFSFGPGKEKIGGFATRTVDTTVVGNQMRKVNARLVQMDYQHNVKPPISWRETRYLIFGSRQTNQPPLWYQLEEGFVAVNVVDSLHFEFFFKKPG